jgi:hypothetical protein
MKNLTILLLPLALLAAISSSGQAALGLRFQQFGGINSTLLNPAMGALYHKKWDLNLVELGSSVSNNYIFVENAKAGEFNRFRSVDSLYSRPDLSSDQNLSPNSLVVDYFTREGDYFGEIRLNVLGPSFLLRLGQHGIGFTTRARTELETSFATDLGYYTYLNNRGSVNMTPSHINGAAWREWGLHYDYSIGSAEDRRLALGVNLRYLQGYEGFSISNEQFSYDKTGVDSFEVNPGAARLAFTTGNLNTDADTPFEPKVQGKGWGLDLGAIYEYVGANWNCNLGASINDLGSIRFRNTAQLHQFRTQNIQTIRTSPYTTWDAAADIVNKAALLSEWANGNPQASLVDSAFTVGLPTHLVLQAGFYKIKGLRFFAMYQQPLSFSQNQLQAASNLAVVGGWENNWVGAYLPLSLYRWQRLRMGAAVRLAFLTLGTDNLGPWITRGDLAEADFYLAVKISPWPENWFKGGGKVRTGKKRGGKGSDCYTF